MPITAFLDIHVKPESLTEAPELLRDTLLTTRAFDGCLGVDVLIDTEDPTRVTAQIEENIRRIVHALLEDPATTKILLSDAVGLDPAFDRKLLSFYEERLRRRGLCV